MSSDAPPPVLSMRGISKSYGTVKVLQGVSCDFWPGEVHCLMGENGAGKSTLIKMVSGAIQPDGGSIELSGGSGRHGPAQARELGIATIYQELDLIPNLSGTENILLGREPLGALGRIDKAASRSRAQAILQSMKVTVDLGRPVQELGIAQQQMIAIAKSLVGDCRLIIFDEPTAVFTQAETDALFDLIRRMRSDGIAIVFISHHLEEIFEIGDRITVLRDGKVASTGPIAEYDRDRLVRDMVGREISRPTHRNWKPEEHDVLLRVDRIGDGDKIRDVTLEIRKGEIVGMAGLIGAGRTEVARMLFGAARVESGTIQLNGQPITPRTPIDAIAAGIGMVPEDRKRDGLVLKRSVGENAAYTLVRKLARNGIVPWSRIRAQTEEQARVLSIKTAGLHAQVGRLSGGNQQKVVLARWLSAGVSLLILDEPTRGVDVGARSEIYNVIRQLADQGMGVLLISSDLTEVLSQCDRIYVMAGGRIAGEVDGQEASEEKIMALAFKSEAGERI